MEETIGVTDSLKAPVIGKKAYDKSHKNVCKVLGLAEVHAPRMYAEAIVTDGEQATKVAYLRDGTPITYPVYCSDTKDSLKFRRLSLAERDSRIRVSKFVYLSHVIQQCGLRPKAVRPLWRLLRIGYKIRLSNFKRLVSLVANLCNYRHDFTRDLGAPANGLHHKPQRMLEAKTLMVQGVRVPRWTLTPVYTGDIRDLNLD